MSIVKLAPAAVTGATSAEAIRRLIASDAPLAADSRYLFSQNAEQGSIVVTGAMAGQSFAQYVQAGGENLLGSDARGGTLPFVIRDLGAEQGDLFYSAGKKNQAFWYVLQAPAGSKIYFGFKGSVSPKELEASLEDGSYKSKLEGIDTTKDDLFVIEPGTEYVFEKGLKILEVENCSSFQSEATAGSEETLRHEYHKGDWVADGQAEHVCAGSNDVFELDLFQLDGRLDMDAGGSSCKVLVFLEGTAVVDDHSGETLHCQPETVLFVPANTETFHITGNARFALVHLV